jgi:hypothetical protein
MLHPLVPGVESSATEPTSRLSRPLGLDTPFLKTVFPCYTVNLFEMLLQMIFSAKDSIVG